MAEDKTARKNNNDFYADLDKVKRKESCSCSSMIIFLAFLFFSGVYIVWWGVSQISITLTDQELTSLLIKSEVIAQNDNYYLDNPQANITPSEIVISGQLRKPIRSQVTINGSLVVENKNLSYKVSSIQAGK